LLQDVRWLISQIEGGISCRMQFELNLASVDTWLKNTESDLAKPVRLDADATVIAMMVNKYEVWIHSVMHVYTHNHLNSPCKCI